MERTHFRFKNLRGEAEESAQTEILILEIRDPLCHACDASNQVAMGDHDTLGDARGAAGVHDDSDVRRLRVSAVR